VDVVRFTIFCNNSSGSNGNGDSNCNESLFKFDSPRGTIGNRSDSIRWPASIVSLSGTGIGNKRNASNGNSRNNNNRYGYEPS